MAIDIAITSWTKAPILSTIGSEPLPQAQAECGHQELLVNHFEQLQKSISPVKRCDANNAKRDISAFGIYCSDFYGCRAYIDTYP